MMKIIARPLTVLTTCLCLCCSQGTTVSNDPPPPAPSFANLSAAERSLTSSGSVFGLELFRDIVKHEHADSNVFISPLSISVALGMTANGAVGETREQMYTALQFPELTPSQINEAYKNVIEILPQIDPEITVGIAQSIWYPPHISVQPNFIDLSRAYFSALVRELDFSLPSANDTINIWVAGETNDRIPKLLENRIERDIIMILVNAIYFKGAWMYRFNPDSTTDDQFTLANGSQIACRMMNKLGDVGYFADSLFEAVNLPYGKGDFAMAVFLPRPSLGTLELAEQFTENNWAAWVQRFYEEQVLLQFPKFKIEYGIGLNNHLRRLGMTLPFLPSADFSNMFAGGGGWIDTVIHKAFVEVNEEGTEAAAATVVLMERSGPITFRVDRPFIFVIWERQTGTILFMGKVSRPVGS